MSLRILIACDGTSADRPGMALGRCRAFLPTRATAWPQARAEAAAAGWTRTAEQDCNVVRGDLCHDCSRVADRSAVNGPTS